MASITKAISSSPYSHSHYYDYCYYTLTRNITASSRTGRRLRAAVNCRASSSSSSSSSSDNASGAAAVEDEGAPPPQASPYQILGVDPSCSFPQLRAAFRARVKEFHPDVYKDVKDSETMIRRVIQAYEMLSKHHKFEDTERESVDPFEVPECEAYDLFINEVLCIGKGCPYSCVKMAPYVFSFTPENGTARAISQGQGDDYQVQLAVGQCPRRCIHYVTPLQRAILEELLYSILSAHYDSAETVVLESLTAKAAFENNRYQKPKTPPKASTEFVDWY